MGVMSVISAGYRAPAPTWWAPRHGQHGPLGGGSGHLLHHPARRGHHRDVTLDAQNNNLFDYGTNGAISGELVDVGLAATRRLPALPARSHSPPRRLRPYGRASRPCRRPRRDLHQQDPGYPPVEGEIPGATVPFVGVAGADGYLFSAGQTVTLNGAAPIPNPAYTNFASFTSSGPRQDSFAKPDISAPGVNILSASVGTGTEGLLLSGTSMASPHTAGIAVLVRQAHPTWDPIAVKGAMMSNADPLGVGNFDSVRGGAGMVDAPSAVGAKAYFMTNDGRNSLSFGSPAHRCADAQPVDQDRQHLRRSGHL